MTLHSHFHWNCISVIRNLATSAFCLPGFLPDLVLLPRRNELLLPVALLYLCYCWFAMKEENRKGKGKEKKGKREGWGCRGGKCEVWFWLQICLYFQYLNCFCWGMVFKILSPLTSAVCSFASTSQVGCFSWPIFDALSILLAFL